MWIPFTSETGLLVVNRFLTMPAVNEEVAVLAVLVTINLPYLCLMLAHLGLLTSLVR